MPKITTTKNNNRQKYDVVVIGGGPAGIMAAGRAGESGARVLLLEKNDSLGRKLLMTGNGRCNLTQAEFDDKKLVAEIGKNGKFLFSTFNVFGPEETLDFFAELNVPTKVEENGRAFPISDKSVDVLRALKNYLKKNHVEILLGVNVLVFVMERQSDKKIITGVRLKNEIIRADKFILATGGKSYPATGSIGDGYSWAKECGHTIVAVQPVLVPLKTQEIWVKEVQGVSLKDIKVSLVRGKSVLSPVETQHCCVSTTGDIIFTHFGLSGPAILNLSREMAGLKNEEGQYDIYVDLKPKTDKKDLDVNIQKDFKVKANKNIINYLTEIVPAKLAKVILQLADVPAEKKINIITREERMRLVGLLKNLHLKVAGNMGYAQAMVTRGGVDLREVNPKTMQSKIVSNLFLAGEVLDLDGPTGGYNLQICWSTGYIAGMACGESNEI